MGPAKTSSPAIFENRSDLPSSLKLYKQDFREVARLITPSVVLSPRTSDLLVPAVHADIQRDMGDG